ncbi:MAG: class I SAM-dependent methyltransferase [bacterium]|nr:class I SAM-dependent methyltransferase [bacterium]
MNCVVCNHSDLTPALKDIKNPRLPLGAPTYQYLKCNKCDLWMLDPYPSQELLNQIYDSSYNLYEDTSEGVISKILSQFSPSRIQTVTKYLKGKSNLLDVGCGNGTFLQQINGRNVEAYGTEWSEYAARLAKQKINQEHIHVGELQDIPWKEKFNCITAWHVLEHNRQPNNFISSIKQKITDDGYFILEVPNSNSEVLNRTNKKYAWFSIPEHVTYWNERALQDLAKNHGFEVLESRTPFAMPLLYAKSRTNSAIQKLESLVVQWRASRNKRGDIIRQVWKVCP